MDAQVTDTWCCNSCGDRISVQRARCRCGGTYIPPGELAAMAVKANPDKSARAIAEELGIGRATVDRARTGSNEPVDKKRTGRDGKTRKMPGVRQPPRGFKSDDAKRAEGARMFIDGGLSREEIKERTGLGLQETQLLVERERGYREALAAVGAAPDFSKMSAKQKLDAAIRAHRKLLDREYEAKRFADVEANIKRIMPTLQEEKNAAFRRERDYREYLQKAKKVMTVAEYTQVCSCLHPDSRGSVSEEKLKRTFQMFEPKKFALTGEK